MHRVLGPLSSATAGAVRGLVKLWAFSVAVQLHKRSPVGLLWRTLLNFATVARAPSSPSLKKKVLEALFLFCQERNDMTFTNDEVKYIAAKLHFGNPFDVTKVDSRQGLPESIRAKGYCIAHIGKGKHRFIPELKYWYHDFEDIQPNELFVWRYKKSLINSIDRGEASTLSLLLNQRTLYDFIYEDITVSPKIYIPGRTKADLKYWVGRTFIEAKSQQIEMDLVLEYQGVVTIVEAKNQIMPNFAVYQLFHPVKYYLDKARHLGIDISRIQGCYVMKGKGEPETIMLRMYLYGFSDENRLDSITLIRKAEYKLIVR